MSIDIITCPQWGARQSKSSIVRTGKQSKRIIIHHTAGHHPEISIPTNESREEAIAYAKSIQNFHMDSNGWIDSGHNFLVCRNGLILQGRWLTVTAIEHGDMVISAHCPSQNDQIGIEHEHLGTEIMTELQRQSSANLIAWISKMYKLDHVLPLFPHSKYYPTACPGNLMTEIPNLARMANQLLHAT